MQMPPLTLVDRIVVALERHAQTQPDELALRFLVTGDVEGEQIELTYAGLLARVRAIARGLRAAGIERGDRVLLLFEGGPDFLATLVACFGIGAVAVPTYPPDAARFHRTLPRLQAMVIDAGARFVATTQEILQASEPLCVQAEGLRHLRWCAVDQPVGEDSTASSELDVVEEIAYLQYTSGSTGNPKGVIVTHDNLRLSCTDFLRRWFEGPDQHLVNWLPTFHDFGLIWGLLTPVTAGFPVTFMLPTAFLQRPLRWLKAIHQFRATSSGGPDFAYALCASRVRDEELKGLDLSSLRVVMNAAEPIRPDTLRAFSRRFGPVGFRAEAMCPGFGLAEAVLQVTMSSFQQGAPTLLSLDAKALEQGIILESTEGSEPCKIAVGCGFTAPETTLRIVDPETREALPPNRVGEIWIQGPLIAAGYWGRPEETQQTFHARLAGEEEGLHWLRTGDLGFLHHQELFIAGRLKDVIIIRGRNLYPQDLEVTAERVHKAIRPGCAAAFSLDHEGAERIVLVCEVEPSRIELDPSALLQLIRQAIAEAFEVQLYRLVLIRPRTIPKTSSGKIQRRQTRANLLKGALEVVAEWTAPSPAAPSPTAPSPTAVSPTAVPPTAPSPTAPVAPTVAAPPSSPAPSALIPPGAPERTRESATRQGSRGRQAWAPAELRRPPMLGVGLRSSVRPEEQLWQVRLLEDGLTFLHDHAVEGVPLIPVTAFLEQGLEAAHERLGTTELTLTDLQLERPLLFSNQERQLLQVVLQAETSDRGAMSFSSSTSLSPSWVLHARLKVYARTRELPPDRHREKPEEVKGRLGRPRAGQGHLEHAGTPTLHRGPAFKGLERLWGGQTEALGRVRLPEHLDATGHLFHPAALDACLQVAAGLEAFRGEVYLPVGVDRLVLHTPPRGELWVHVQLRSAPELLPGSGVCDVTITTPSGQPFADLTGVHFCRMEALMERVSGWAGRRSSSAGTSLAEQPFRHPSQDSSEAALPVQRLRAFSGTERRRELLQWLRQTAAAILRVPLDMVEEGCPLTALGMDSLNGLELRQAIETALSVRLSGNLLWQRSRPGELVDTLLSCLDETGGGDGSAGKGLIEARAPLTLDSSVLVRDAQLDADFPTPTGELLAEQVRSPRLLVLSGATGFLGSFLVAELLERTQATLVCLVRARDPQHAQERLRTALIGQGVWKDAYHERLRALPADLSLPGLGLSPELWAELSENADAVFHNGAWLNWVLPYEQLRPTIVGGTRELLRLAALGRIKPFHYISTSLASIQFKGHAGLTAGLEAREERISGLMDDAYMRRRLFHVGYTQAKWVADELVDQAHARGVPVSIYRMPFIAGHSRDGRWPGTDLIGLLLRGCCLLGAAPRQDVVMDLVPVDCISMALGELALSPTALGRRFQMSSLAPMHWEAVVEVLRQRGYPVELVSAEVWIERLRSCGPIPGLAELYKLLPYFESSEKDRLVGGYEPYRETPQTLTERSTLQQLSHPERWVSVDAARLNLYLSRLELAGWPGGRAEVRLSGHTRRS